MSSPTPDDWWATLSPRRKRQIYRWVARGTSGRPRLEAWPGELPGQMALTDPDGLPPSTSTGR